MVDQIRPSGWKSLYSCVVNAADDLENRVKQLAQGGRSHVSRQKFAKQYGASAGDLAAVKRFAKKHGLAVVQEDAVRRSVVLSGSVSQFNAAFGVDLQRFVYDGGSYRGRTGAVRLPRELNGIVEGVLGLDNRPQAEPHFRPVSRTAMSIRRQHRVPLIQTK